MGMLKVSIVGVGRLGGALALALDKSCQTIDALIYRNGHTAEAVAARLRVPPKMVQATGPEKLSSDVFIVAAGDPEIGPAAAAAAQMAEKPAIFLHTSGSLSSEVIGELRGSGHFVGSMHPLASISDPELGVKNFDGAFFCIEGDEQAAAAATTIAEALGGRPFSIPADKKALYHASAVMACGHLVALIDIATEMLVKCGVGSETAANLLMPLVRSTISNLAATSAEAALTGSFARGDAAAVGRHVDAIAGSGSQSMLDVYIDLGRRSLEIAERRGLDPAAAEAVRSRLSMAKTGREC